MELMEKGGWSGQKRQKCSGTFNHAEAMRNQLLLWQTSKTNVALKHCGCQGSRNGLCQFPVSHRSFLAVASQQQTARKVQFKRSDVNPPIQLANSSKPHCPALSCFFAVENSAPNDFSQKRAMSAQRNAISNQHWLVRAA